MDRGFYSVAAGILTGQKAVNVMSNNVANVNTAGYKSQGTLQTSFGEYLLSRMSSAPNIAKNDIGTGSYMTVNSGQYTDFSQGSIEKTGRNVDMAIQGDGFFLVQSDAYGQVLTRNGQFEINETGNLILPGVGNVLNSNGQPITVTSSDFSLSSDGKILENGVATQTLYIATVTNKNDLKQVGTGFFQTQNGFQEALTENFSIIQGAIEKSNTDMTTEMSQIIARQNNFQSCAQVLKIYDRINEISANQVGKIG
ncbi:MAG: flagellar hook-basal body protein [Acetobacterium sp.]